LKYIDLYAGLGGFHQALDKLGHECVWACEYNFNLRNLYQKNFPNTPVVEGDIFNVDISMIPDHDVICAGFPCQPFSRAGKMLGFDDLSKGNHFFQILKIIDSKVGNKKPQFIILENVETLLRHDSNRTFKIIKHELESRNYEIQYDILSPHEFNIPHHRRRLFIVAGLVHKGGLNGFKFPSKKIDKNLSINKILNDQITPFEGENVYLSKELQDVINFWKGFIELFSDENPLPGFPIWSHEWGATYPFDDITPSHMPLEQLKMYKGMFGKRIAGKTRDEVLNLIPRYSHTGQLKFPAWKIKFIAKNREFYSKNRELIDTYLEKNPEFKQFDFSYQKLEWSCQKAKHTMDDKIIQFRPSGVRVKLSNWSPALTTVKTQNIYLPKLQRKLSIQELAKLQSMELSSLPDIYDGKFVPNGGYRAFGNAVNVEVVRLIAKNLIGYGS